MSSSMKTTYKRSELGDAVTQMFRLKVKGWKGVLKLETEDGKKFFISQFPSSSSWSEGCNTVFSLDDSFEPWFETGVPKRQQTLKRWEDSSWDYVNDAIEDTEREVSEQYGEVSA
jgi:hypothetical protein